MNDNVEIIRSNKGGMKIIHRGYMYTVHKKRQGGGIRWRCTQRSLHCKGSISTGNGPPSVNMPHNHIPDPHSVALARCRQLEEFPDIASLLETEYEEIKDSMPLQQRMLMSAPQVQIPSSSESPLQSQPLSPTKLKVTRQSNKPQPSFPPKHDTPPVVPPEEVCLRWNSHHSNMQASFPQLLEKEQYVDVTLIAEGKTLKCHRMILSSCSAYFEEILTGITPQQHPVIILKGIPFWILKALTDFMYVGEVNIDQNKLPELLDVAELLKVKGLAGKSNSSDNQSKPENQPPKKPQARDTTPRQSVLKNPPQMTPIIAKVEEMPITDPLELLEPKFQEDSDGPASRLKENKFLSRKILNRKITRKRRSSEDESPLPLFPMRRGTRSRPNVKIPKYYDYEDIIKPTASDTQPLSPIVTIKSEPVDVEESDMYTESGENSLNISNDLESATPKVDSTNPKPSEKKTPLTESPALITKISRRQEKEQLPPQYKIKIKCFSSLLESSSSTSVNDTSEDLRDNAVNNKPPSLEESDNAITGDAANENEATNSVNETNISTDSNKSRIQNEPNVDGGALSDMKVEVVDPLISEDVDPLSTVHDKEAAVDVIEKTEIEN